MYTNIVNVNAAIAELKQSESGLIEPFTLRCRELGLLLHYVQGRDEREVLVQLFRPYLIDECYDEFLDSLEFVSEREHYKKVLSTFSSVEASYACDVTDVASGVK